MSTARLRLPLPVVQVALRRPRLGPAIAAANESNFPQRAEDAEEDEEGPPPAPTPAPAPARRAPAPAPAPAAGTSASDARASVTDVLARMRAQREESRAKMAQSLNATVRLLLLHPASPQA